MSRKTIKYLLLLGFIAALAMVLVACTGANTQITAATVGVAPTQAPIPTCPVTKEPTPCPTAAPAQSSLVKPFEDAWAASAHADAKAPAFTHWDTTSDKMVPTSCATCHSATGYQDFLGADGSAAGKVDKAQPIGTTVTCVACHNDAAAKLTSVTFPSGAVISGLGPEARCMVCHQGRASKVQVDKQITDFKATDPDGVVAPIKNGDTTQTFGFLNIHYFAAAATLYGTEVKGGYEYDGKTYDTKFMHTTGVDTCISCHDQHTLKIRVDVCAECHQGVKTVDDLKNIRMVSSSVDYNGNGDVKEGMAMEIKGMQDALYKGIQTYAKEVVKSGVVYDPATYPYFLLDKNNDGQADKDDKGAAIGFNAWTPRMLKAAYNYQLSVKDPGAFAHGNKYIVQLLYDSLADLNTKLTTQVDISKMHREDAGHFAGDTLPFRDWDTTGVVPASCSKCHTATGLPQFIKEGANISNPASNGFLCSTCHDEANFPANYKLTDVTFPSGAKVSFGDGDPANVCLMCHQGRESTASVTKALAAYKEPDTANAKISFRNVHYLAAGATLFGHDVQGMFEYPNKTYAGRFLHTQGVDKCTSCHDVHALTVKTDTCKGCHGTDDPTTIRKNSTEDYNGNGDVKEGLAGEVKGYQTTLYAAIQKYAVDVLKTPIIYDTTSYPYFFLDKNGDGKPDVDDKGAKISYNAWSPRLLEAAYNLQYSYKDPGAYVHNAHYVMQAMYDSLADLKTKVPSIDISKMVRPK